MVWLVVFLALWAVARVWEVRETRRCVHRRQVAAGLDAVSAVRGRHPAGWSR